MPNSKPALRKQFRNLRLEMSLAAFSKSEDQIIAHLAQYLNNFNTIHLFLPIQRLREINTFRLLHTDSLKDKNWCTSIVTPEQNLKHTYVSLKSEYAEDAWGIPTPVEFEEASLPDIDIVLIPLLAIDNKGNRVGYGKGFYDKFLSELPQQNTVFCGVSLFSPIQENITPEPHDIPLHCCVTPNGMVTFTPDEYRR